MIFVYLLTLLVIKKMSEIIKRLNMGKADLFSVLMDKYAKKLINQLNYKFFIN